MTLAEFACVDLGAPRVRPRLLSVARSTSERVDVLNVTRETLAFD
jgi:hypothetical protein